jgi:hypothetical protein
LQEPFGGWDLGVRVHMYSGIWPTVPAHLMSGSHFVHTKHCEKEKSAPNINRKKSCDFFRGVEAGKHYKIGYEGFANTKQLSLYLTVKIATDHLSA